MSSVPPPAATDSGRAEADRSDGPPPEARQRSPEGGATAASAPGSPMRGDPPARPRGTSPSPGPSAR
eukprot:6801995-Alexandrium_andersonii.AAC.1